MLAAPTRRSRPAGRAPHPPPIEGVRLARDRTDIPACTRAAPVAIAFGRGGRVSALDLGFLSLLVLTRCSILNVFSAFGQNETASVAAVLGRVSRVIMGLVKNEHGVGGVRQADPTPARDRGLKAVAAANRLGKTALIEFDNILAGVDCTHRTGRMARRAHVIDH